MVRSSFLEKRSIDYVPLAERHGKVWHLWPVWFSGDAHLATLAVGAIGIALGGNLLWTAVAVFAGCAIGTTAAAGCGTGTGARPHAVTTSVAAAVCSTIMPFRTSISVPPGSSASWSFVAPSGSATQAR